MPTMFWSSVTPRRWSHGGGICTLVVASVIIYFRSGHRVTDIGVGQAISLLGIAVFAAFSGKLVGLIWARWRLIWIASRLYHMVVSHASPNRCPGLTSEG